jgi:hypothetical protein
MNKIFSAAIFAFIAISVLSPATTHAYKTSDQSTLKITDTVTLYAIEFSFGHGSHDTYIPVVTMRDQIWGKKVRTLGYEVLDDNENTQNNSALGIVTSNATITDDQMYFIPKGESKTFTLYILLTETDSNSTEDYSVHVTDLPFYWGNDRQYQRLNVSELKKYQTPTT